jgi:hypothetical protein
VESQGEQTGFSAGERKSPPTNTENTDNRATDITDGNREQSESDSGEHAESNGSRTKENKRSPEHKLDRTRSKTRNLPKNQAISVVFNYSKVELAQPMRNLLNRGFNFSILPLKLDLTQVLVDFKRFERSIIWHEFFHRTENDGDFKGRIFKSSKSNLPKNYKSPEGLKTYLSSIKSEIMDHRNRNNVECNLA